MWGYVFNSPMWVGRCQIVNLVNLLFGRLVCVVVCLLVNFIRIGMCVWVSGVTWVTWVPPVGSLGSPLLGPLYVCVI